MPYPPRRSVLTFARALSCAGLLLALAGETSAQPPAFGSDKYKRNFWAGASMGLSVPVVRDARIEDRLQVSLMPSGMISWLFGASWGPIVIAGRLDLGLGGLRSRSRTPERGLGYLVTVGPVFRATLFEGETHGIALVADSSLMHVGTASEEGCWDPCDTVPKQYPQLGLQALAPGAALQLMSKRKQLSFELRYQRAYWFHLGDQADQPTVRAWDLMPTDRFSVSVGGWFGGRSPRDGRRTR